MRKDRPHFVLRENPGLQVQRYHHATSTRPWHGQWQMRLTRKARVRRGPTPMQLLTAQSPTWPQALEGGPTPGSNSTTMPVAPTRR